ncbi:MAG: hypothetical protein ABII24_01855 [bacterium]
MSCHTQASSPLSLTKSAIKSALLLLGFVSLIAFTPSARAESGNLSLSLTPESPTVRSGESIDFLVIAKDKKTDHTWEVNDFAEFTVTDPAGTINQGVYQAGKAGTWTVLASYNGTSASTLVRVQPGPVKKIEISPNSKPEIIALGNRTSFKAAAFDSLGNSITNPTVTWSLEGLIGTLDSGGKFSGTNPGNGSIIAKIDGVKSVVDIAVTQPAAQKTETIVSETTEETNNTSISGTFETDIQEGEVLGEQDEVNKDNSNQKESASEATCWDIKWWGWLIVMIGFLALLLGYYYLVRATKSAWLWAVPLLLIVALLVVFFSFRCDSAAGWFPWISIIAALLITLFRPMRFIPTNGDSL